jgi:hypothetical protein
MSLTVSEARAAVHEGDFINFCQAVSDTLIPTPYWDRNLKQFNTIFLKFKIHGKSYLPILEFCKTHREVLEAPIVDSEGDCNDSWLSIPDGTPVPVPPNWMPIIPRGVFLPMAEIKPTHSLPLAEVYARCVEIANGSQNYFGVSAASAPAKFLFLFYQMLHEADPENEHYKRNMTSCQEMIVPTEVSNPLSGILSGLSTFLTPEAQASIQGVAEGVANSFTQESRDQAVNAFSTFQQKGDISSLFNASQSLLANPSVQSLFASIMPMMQGMMGAMPGAAVQETVADTQTCDTVVEGVCDTVDPECTEQE